MRSSCCRQISQFSCICLFFFFKQKTAYELRISDWSSDVCSSDLATMTNPRAHAQESKIATPHRIRAKLKRFFGPWGMFVRGFIKHPVMVGSIVPSSPTLIRHMLRPVDWKTTKLFVEYGPGVGTFCRPILEHLPGDATLIAIDTNEDFIDYLTKDIRARRFVRSDEHKSELQYL